MKFTENPFGGSRVVPCGRTNGQRDMTGLIETFSQFCERARKSIELSGSVDRPRTDTSCVCVQAKRSANPVRVALVLLCVLQAATGHLYQYHSSCVA